MTEIIINFCPTGMIPTKEMTPHVPVSENEIIEQVHEAYEVGITIAHLHARDIDGVPTWDPTIYRNIFEGIRMHCPDLIICGSTSGRNFPEFEKRSAVIELKPDMCSLTLSSLNFVQQASINEPNMIKNLALKMTEYGVTPELECFDMGMINFGKYLIKKEILKGPFYWNVLFGNIAGLQVGFDQIAAVLNAIPDGHFIGMAGLGENQLPLNTTAIANGYGVRVGIEDNIWWNKSEKILCSNMDLLNRIHQIIEISQNKFMEAKTFGDLGFKNQLND